MATGSEEVMANVLSPKGRYDILMRDPEAPKHNFSTFRQIETHVIEPGKNPVLRIRAKGDSQQTDLPEVEMDLNTFRDAYQLKYVENGIFHLGCLNHNEMKTRLVSMTGDQIQETARAFGLKVTPVKPS